MFCTKCGTQCLDNGLCPNCSAEENILKTEIPSSSPLNTVNEQPQATPEPQAYAEPQQPSFTPNESAQNTNNMYNDPPVSTAYAPVPPHAGAPVTASGKKPNFIAQIIIAICMFICMFTLPIIPHFDDMTFGRFYAEFFENIDEIDMFFDALGSADGIIGMIYSMVLIMAFGFLLASVLLLIFSLVKNKTMCIISSVLGILSLLSPIILVTMYGISEGIELGEDYFEFMFESFGTGVWIPVILFIVHIIVTACTKKK